MGLIKENPINVPTPEPRPFAGFLAKILVLGFVALCGWLVHLWVFAHPTAHWVHMRGEADSPPAASPQSDVNPYQSAPAPVSPAAQIPPAYEVRKPFPMPSKPLPAVNEPLPAGPMKKLGYPEDLGRIINAADWPYVRSALVVAHRLGNAQRVRWLNPRGGHQGEVILSGPMEDAQGCRQFRVTSKTQDNGDARIAHVDYCRDGTIR